MTSMSSGLPSVPVQALLHPVLLPSNLPHRTTWRFVSSSVFRHSTTAQSVSRQEPSLYAEQFRVDKIASTPLDHLLERILMDFHSSAFALPFYAAVVWDQRIGDTIFIDS
jgi:hypothetical protein